MVTAMTVIDSHNYGYTNVDNELSYEISYKGVSWILARLKVD